MIRPENNILSVAYLNIRGQSGLNIVKQLQIEAFAKYNHCDIVHLQGAHIEDETFSTCDCICFSYNIIQNNSITKYGTASLVKTELCAEDIRCDSEGRVIVKLEAKLNTIIGLHTCCSDPIRSPDLPLFDKF